MLAAVTTLPAGSGEAWSASSRGQDLARTRARMEPEVGRAGLGHTGLSNSSLPQPPQNYDEGPHPLISGEGREGSGNKILKQKQTGSKQLN